VSVYIIVLCQIDDFYYYILDEPNWDALGDGPLCESTHKVELLHEPDTLKEAFDLVDIHGYEVEGTGQGVMY
jgi:hypothetical protein